MSNSNLNRRSLIAGAGAVSLAAAFAVPAAALNTAQAERLVGEVVARINQIINSGQTEARMLRSFEQVFQQYANTTVIAFRVLGADARSASDAQKREFIEVFEGYIARKYGRRFREFEGGRIVVEEAREVKSWHEVRTTSHLQGEAPFRVDFLVKEAGGRDLFFDMVIEGISLTRVEREEIGSMLDRRGGDLDRLIADLRNAG